MRSRAMPKWPAEQVARREWAGQCPIEGCVLPCGHTAPCKRGEIEEEDYEVERITAERTVGGTTQYLIKWVGWPDEDSTWETADALENAQGVLARWQEGRGGWRKGRWPAVRPPSLQAGRQPEDAGEGGDRAAAHARRRDAGGAAALGRAVVPIGRELRRWRGGARARGPERATGAALPLAHVEAPDEALRRGSHRARPERRGR